MNQGRITVARSEGYLRYSTPYCGQRKSERLPELDRVRAWLPREDDNISSPVPGRAGNEMDAHATPPEAANAHSPPVMAMSDKGSAWGETGRCGTAQTRDLADCFGLPPSVPTYFMLTLHVRAAAPLTIF